MDWENLLGQLLQMCLHYLCLHRETSFVSSINVFTTTDI